MDAKKLVELAMIRTGCTSARQLAKLANVSNVTASRWINNDMCPTFEQCCELAEMAGLPPVSTAAEVRQHSIDGPKHRKILARLAKFAACALLTLGSVGTPRLHANERTDLASHNQGGCVYYVKRFKLRESFGMLLACLRRFLREGNGSHEVSLAV